MQTYDSANANTINIKPCVYVYTYMYTVTPYSTKLHRRHSAHTYSRRIGAQLTQHPSLAGGNGSAPRRRRQASHFPSTPLFPRTPPHSVHLDPYDTNAGARVRQQWSHRPSSPTSPTPNPPHTIHLGSTGAGANGGGGCLVVINASARARARTSAATISACTSAAVARRQWSHRPSAPTSPTPTPPHTLHLLAGAITAWG